MRRTSTARTMNTSKEHDSPKFPVGQSRAVYYGCHWWWLDDKPWPCGPPLLPPPWMEFISSHMNATLRVSLRNPRSSWISYGLPPVTIIMFPWAVFSVSLYSSLPKTLKFSFYWWPTMAPWYSICVAICIGNVFKLKEFRTNNESKHN